MTDETATPEPTPTPTGLKATANEVGLKLFMKAPPKAQNALLNGIGKAQPVINKLKPHAKQLAMGGASLLLVRTIRHRKG